MPLVPAAPAIAPPVVRRLGRVIVVFGAQDGVGKTTVATNLAVSLAHQLKQPVGLLDLDVRAPGVAALLGVQPTRSLTDAAGAWKRASTAERTEWNGLAVGHTSGVEVLSAVTHPRPAAQVDPKILSLAMPMLRNRYAYLVVDAGNAFSELLLAACALANLGLLVTSPDLMAQYQTKWVLGMLETLAFPPGMMKVVLNRAEPQEDVTAQAFCATTCPSEVLGQIPEDARIAGTALQQSSPLATTFERTGIAEAFERLADLLLARQELYVTEQDLARFRQEADKKAGVTLHPTVWFSRLYTAGEFSTSETDAITDEVALLKRRVHSQLLELPDLKSTQGPSAATSKAQWLELRQKTERIITNLLSRESSASIASSQVRGRLVKEIAEEALGLGPLESLLADPDVTDILINGKDQVYVERHGRLELTTKQFVSTDQLRAVIERILAPLGRHIDESNPMVDARLPDGSRVSVVIPPLAIHGPKISIRKFAKMRYSTEDLLRAGSLTEAMAKFLNACVRARKNLVISGGAGSGKTTLLNAISIFIPESERIISIEDAAELRLAQRHWVSLEARPSNIEGKGEVAIRDLFRHALRMRPDRIVIGECRGAETLDMLQAMNTGHEGSITTVHANSPHDVIARMDSMVLMSNVDIPVRAIREMIASAIDVIIHTARLSDGSRKIIAITELVGLANDLDVTLHDLFVFRQRGLTPEGAVVGDFAATGTRPTFLEELAIKGLGLDAALFDPPQSPA